MGDKELIMNTNEKQKTLSYYFAEIRDKKLLTKEEEINLAMRVEKNDKKAVEKLVNSNLKLVIKIAKYYLSRDLLLEDLIQEGNIGLITAVTKFDYRRNVRFATYATWWIKQSIIRSLATKKRAIRLPNRKEDDLRKIRKVTSELFQENGRTPKIDEISSRSGLTEPQILNLIQFNEKIASIDAEIQDDGGCLANTIVDNNYNPSLIYAKKEIIVETTKVLEKLKEKEKFVLKNRFAIDTDKTSTLKGLADQMGMSSESVRQLEIRAINKIKRDYAYLGDFLVQ